MIRHLLLPLFAVTALGAQARAPSADFCAAARGIPARDAIARLPMPLVPTPEPVRGLYVNRWAAIGSRLDDLIRIAEETEINALVIDVKDDRGFLLYRSRVALARAIGADTNRPLRHEKLRAALDTMRARGIYPIARIVVAKDPLLATARPEWAIRSRADTSRPWRDKQGLPWLDAHQPGPWKYAAELACEAVDLGFSEVQFDYVRFPDEDRLRREAVFPLAKGRTRAKVIREQLIALRARLRPLRVPVTADVFGLTTTDTSDMGIGQQWEQLVNTVDVILPMVYPSHYAPGAYGLDDPNAHPSVVIRRSLTDAQRRSAGVPGAAPIRPWYQDFTLGPPRYGAAQVRAQIEAGYKLGVMSWLLWNPRSYYSRSALEPRENGARGTDVSHPARLHAPPKRICADTGALGATELSYVTTLGTADDSLSKEWRALFKIQRLERVQIVPVADEATCAHALKAFRGWYGKGSTSTRVHVIKFGRYYWVDDPDLDTHDDGRPWILFRDDWVEVMAFGT